MTAMTSMTGKTTTPDGHKMDQVFQRCSHSGGRQFAMKLPWWDEVYSPFAFASDTSVRTS
jgi:hypothetical protein